ncbi:MAG: Hsp20/alpha crystallin family protein [Deltaproteobacteria bacterium]|nr:Hsp20/alpha crystallin family protein [Deltaproteobacteria bacterium]
MARMFDLIPRTSVMLPVRDMFDRFFDDERVGNILSEDKSFVPAFDISESDTEYSVVAEMPGIDEKDLDVMLTDGILTIKGEKKQETDEKIETYHRIERRYGSFQRSFRVPDGVQSDKIDATYKDGILKLLIPKSETSEAKKIEIKH